MTSPNKASRKHAVRLLGAQLCLAALIAQGQPALAQSAAEFDGVWIAEEPTKELVTSSGDLPPLLPASLELYQERRSQALRNDLSFDSVASKCAMPGTTRILTMPYPFQIFQNEHRVVFVYEFNHNFRSMPITHSAPVAAWGTSYGAGAVSFVGDRMTVSTTGLVDDSLLDAMGMPHSEALTVTETYRLLGNGNRLSVNLRIEDPATFSAPWEAVVTFRRLENYDLQEDVCLDRVADGGPAIDWERSRR